MAIDINSEDGQIVRKLIPLGTLPGAQFNVLCENMNIEEVQGGTLFKKGDTDTRLIYLLSGEVTLQAEGLIIEVIAAESEAARFALAHQIPRKIDAVANGAVRFLRLDAGMVNNPAPLVYKEDNSYMVNEEPEDDPNDWMTALLRSPVFQRLPPANLQKVLITLEEVSVDAGEPIIKQGDQGDYYYLIKSGHCLVSRKPSPNAKEIKLAQLGKGDAFGEDALLSGAPRNVTITALTNMVVLRLDKYHFLSLIKEPLLKFITHEQMRKALSQGATLLDVRSLDEHRAGHLPGSINAPFFSLRMQLKTFNREQPVIVVCADGKASEAAAFLLLRHRFDALILDGGMNAVTEPKAKKEAAEQKRETAQFIIDDGTETLTSHADGVHLQHQPQQQAVQAPSISASDDLVKALKSENEALRKLNLQLSEKCQNLEIEKEEALKQSRMLRRQMEKLTQVLNKA
ncbi:cyclic nucleotide-binding domain-containing protein [Methylobacter sp. BBA5.1]|uniref:cyclic nucleotide-binding domain-containing protein n=1 Tax=Methylobacter sp. BBA5.1 TaxID=1495064 RepID=UPI00055CC2BB|nr:cyclic nucleotide-binding domain-containing protein [Methylobacter sp. BBA5.1]